MTAPVDFGAAFAAALAPIVRTAVADALAAHEPPQPPPALLDGHALARELGVSERQVRRLRAEGLPCVRIVESYRYELGAVLAWLKAQEAAK